MSGGFWDDDEDEDEITISFDDQPLGEIKISRTDGHLVAGYRELAQRITEELRPDDWDDLRARSFEEDLFRIVRHLRDGFPDFFTKNSDGRDGLKFIHQRLENEATVLEKYVETFGRTEFTFGHELLTAIRYVPEKADRRAEVERAARELLSPQPFPISEVLGTLARYKRFQAGVLKKTFKTRGHQTATSFLARAIWNLLNRYGIEPVAHTVNEDGMTTGALVTACAMLRGDNPTRAFWAVKAAEKLRKDFGISKPRKAKRKPAARRP